MKIFEIVLRIKRAIIICLLLIIPPEIGVASSFFEPKSCSEPFEVIDIVSTLNFDHYKKNQLVKAAFEVLFAKPHLSAYAKSQIWEHMVRQQGIYNFSSYKIMIERDDLAGYVYLGTIASLELKAGLFISEQGVPTTFHLTDEIVGAYGGRVNEVDGNLVLRFARAEKESWFVDQLIDMIQLELE